MRRMAFDWYESVVGKPAPAKGTVPKVLCLECGTAFTELKRSDGQPWCGCGAARLVYLRPVKNGGLA